MKTGFCIMLLSAMTLAGPLIATSQSVPKTEPSLLAGMTIGSTREGVSAELLNEYSAIISKYGNTGEKWWTHFEQKLSVEDRSRLEQIFKQMSPEQQAKQQLAFIKPPQPLKKVVPSVKEFDSWKNPNVYGIWIDGKKVENSALDKYKNDDFEQATISKLYGAAKRNKKYSFQVDLMTKNYYRHYYEQTTATGGTQIVFRTS